MSPDAITDELQLVNTYRAHLAAVTSALSPHAQAAPPVCQPRSERQALASSEEIRHVVRPAAHDRFHEHAELSAPLRGTRGASALSRMGLCALLSHCGAHLPRADHGSGLRGNGAPPNDCFRDLDGLRAADSYGDDAGASRPAEHVLAARSLSSTPPAYETGDPILARLAKPTPLSSTESLRRPLAWRRRHSDSAWSLFPSVHRGTSQGLRTPLLLARRLHHAAGSRCGQPGS